VNEDLAVADVDADVARARLSEHNDEICTGQTRRREECTAGDLEPAGNAIGSQSFVATSNTWTSLKYSTPLKPPKTTTLLSTVTAECMARFEGDFSLGIIMDHDSLSAKAKRLRQRAEQQAK
jgi:hypothetical protein